MKQKVEWNAALFGVGAAGYGGIEVMARGYTHWSMLLTGGVCLVCLYQLHRTLCARPLPLQAAAGAAAVTGIELAVGLTVNGWLNLGVWDYSHEPLNLWGQICPRFTAAWFGLCLLVMAGFSFLEKRSRAFRRRLDF